MKKIEKAYEMKLGYRHYREHCGMIAYDYPTYKKIVSLFLKYAVDTIVDKGVFALPVNFGKIEITGSKPKAKFREDGSLKLKIDFNRTMEMWKSDPEAKKARKYVYFFNENTNGYVYKISWRTEKSLITARKMFTFKPSNTIKEKLAKNLKEGKEYIKL